MFNNSLKTHVGREICWWQKVNHYVFKAKYKIILNYILFVYFSEFLIVSTGKYHWSVTIFLAIVLPIDAES